MKKIFFYSLLIIPILWNTVNAQVLEFSDAEKTTSSAAKQTTAKQTAIEKALKNRLFIIKESYQLKAQYPGRDNSAGSDTIYTLIVRRNTSETSVNNLDFGIVYTFGVQTDKGFYSDARVISPWNYDPYFEEYKKSQYVPVISGSEYRNWGGSDYKKLPFTAKMATMIDDSIVFVKKKISKEIGIAETAAAGKGWLIFIIQKDKNKLSDSFSLEMIESEQNFEPGNPYSEIVGKTVPATTTGGLFVIEQIDSKGQLSVALSGMIIKSGGKWFVKKI